MHLLVSNFVSVEKFDIYILGDCTFNIRRPELYTISFLFSSIFFPLTFIFWNSKTQPKPLSFWLKQHSCQTHKNKNWLQNLVCVFVVFQRTRKKKLQSKNEILKWNIFNEFDVLADNERMENKKTRTKEFFFLIRFNQTNEKLCETK